MEIKGDQSGTELFEFMSDNTTTEWGQIKTGEEDCGINYVSSRGSKSFQENGKKWGSNNLVLSEKISNLSDVREINHSHPSGGNPSSADIDFSKYWDGMIGKNVNYNVYIPSYQRLSPKSYTYMPFTHRIKDYWLDLLLKE